MTALASALTFDPAVHEYRTPDGRRIPSVTEILRAVGVSVDFEAIGAMSSRLADQIDRRRQLGTVVHQDAHSFDDDDLDWSTVDPGVEPYLRAWAAFRENTGLQPLTRERRIFHPVWNVAGTLDGIFLAPSGRTILVDIKLGSPIDAAVHLQTAAYEASYEIEHPESVDERWAVQLTPERSVPYRITPFTDWRDFQKFQACVAVYNEQPERRRQ